MWNTVAMVMLMWHLVVEMLGIGRMGLRGRIGRRMVKVEKLRMLVWLDVLVARWVLVSETGQVTFVQRIGREQRPGLARRGQTRQPVPEPIRARAGG